MPSDSVAQIFVFGLIADFRDGIGQQCLVFSRCQRACMKEAQQRVAHCSQLSKNQFGRIGGPLPRRAQSCFARPLREGLPGIFGGRFDLG